MFKEERTDSYFAHYEFNAPTEWRRVALKMISKNLRPEEDARDLTAPRLCHVRGGRDQTFLGLGTPDD